MMNNTIISRQKSHSRGRAPGHVEVNPDYRDASLQSQVQVRYEEPPLGGRLHHDASIKTIRLEAVCAGT